MGYQDSDYCTTVRPSDPSGNDQDLVPIYITIGYESTRGVNFIQLVFAPTYDNTDSNLESSITLGVTNSSMDFVNLAFTQKNAFLGFIGVTSEYGRPINMLGAITFVCGEKTIDENNETIREDGVIVDGGGSIVSEDEL